MIYAILLFSLFGHPNKSTFKSTVLLPGSCNSIVVSVKPSKNKRLFVNYPGNTEGAAFASSLDEKKGKVTFYECNPTNTPLTIKNVDILWEIK